MIVFHGSNQRVENPDVKHSLRNLHLSLEEAMDCYYKSRLAGMIQEGKEGVQYLDYRALTALFMEMEKA